MTTETIDTVPTKGQALKIELQAAGITRARIAARLGVGEPYVSHWWNGRRNAPRLTAIARRMLREAKRRKATAPEPVAP